MREIGYLTDELLPVPGAASLDADVHASRGD